MSHRVRIPGDRWAFVEGVVFGGIIGLAVGLGLALLLGWRP